MTENAFTFQRAVVMSFFCIFSAILIYGLYSFVDNNFYSDTTAMKSAIDSALIECYALEGSYPDDIEYLSEYGVWFDTENYKYNYDYRGTNIRPSVSVEYIDEK